MKKLLFITFILLAARANAQEARRVFTTTSVATDVGILETGTGIQYHQLTWYVTGSVPTCQVTLESSPDNITFSTVITAQTCTSSGASAISALTVANYFRINVTTKSGAGSVTATYLGFVANPASSGGGTVVSITGTPPIIVAPDPITGTGTISCPTCGAGSGSINGTTALNQISFGTSSPSTISSSPNLTFTQGGNQSNLNLGVNSSITYSSTSNTLLLQTTSGDGEIDLSEGANVLFRGNVTSGVQIVSLMGGQGAPGGITFHAGNSCWGGTTSGVACIGVAAAAGTPNTFIWPTATGGAEQLLATDGGNPQIGHWVDKSGGTNFGTPPVSPNGVTYYGCDTVSGGVAGVGFCLPGVNGRNVTGASDTILLADRMNFVHYTFSGAVAVTVPQAGTTNFANNFAFAVKADSVSTVTLTPTTSQIAGDNGTLGASLVVPSSSTAYCYSWDNANYRCTLAGSGASGFPTLNQVLDPTADKTFNFSGPPYGVTFAQPAGRVRISPYDTGMDIYYGPGSGGEGIITFNTSIGSPEHGTWILGSSLDADDLHDFSIVEESASSTKFRIKLGMAGDMYLQQFGGNVGIGVNPSGSPSAKLEVNGTANFDSTTHAPTPSVGDNSVNVATTAFVTTAIANAVAGVNPAVAVRVATAAILPNSPTYNNGVAGIGATLTTATTNTALVVDGVTLVLNDRVLVKNQASGFQNGVYFVSQVQSIGLAWILTRALDYDMPSDINSTGAIPVVSGTVNTTTQWVITSTVTTVGTDALTYTQFTANPANNVLAVSPGAGVAHFAGSTQTVTSSAVVGTDMTNNTVTATQLASQYSQWLVCDGKGIGDGLNAMAAGTYLMSTCRNTTGVTVTITGIKCFTDNSGTSTLNVAGNTLGALLTGAVTCSSAYAAGTQSANVALTANDYIKFTFVADGTSKQTDWVVTGTF